MNDGRKNCSLTTEDSEALRITQNKIRINRLKRSPKSNQTQKSDINTVTTEINFRTPTRVPRVGFRSSVTDESPNNDSEFQHEIIWDPTSPATPVRNGRGRRRAAVFQSVDISDIVNRIAPKNKRPEDAESSLLQWIGDIAVPCTPEIREARTKTRPRRQNPVEDLLKLAKQFDFNMKEEAHLRPNPQNSTETTYVKQDLFFNGIVPLASPQNRSEAEIRPLGLEDTKMNSDDPLGLLQDDMDLLFDSSTQSVSGNISQAFSGRSQDVAKLASQGGVNLGARASTDSVNPCGVIRVGEVSESSTDRAQYSLPVLSTIEQVGVADDFDDDWHNDDLLDDSLVMEMTQNPELFSEPQRSSTQKQMSKNNSSALAVYRQNCDKVAKSAEPQGLNERLESFQHSQYWNKITGNENARQSAKHHLEMQAFPSCKLPSVLPVSHSVYKTNSQCKNPVEVQRSVPSASVNSSGKVQSVTTTSLGSKSDLSRSVPSATVSTTTTFKINKVAEEEENHPSLEDNVLGDLAAEDLDSIFASDDIWEDGADDDLFCEACEKVEESMVEQDPRQKASVAKPTPQSSQNTMGKREGTFVQPTLSKAQVSDRRAPSSTEQLPGAHSNDTLALDNSTMKSFNRTYTFSRVKSTTGAQSTANKVAIPGSDRAAPATVQSYQSIQHDRMVLKPGNTFNAEPAFCKDTSKAVARRCSAAEIEKKKQQAMERRRQRMLANQNLHGPV